MDPDTIWVSSPFCYTSGSIGHVTKDCHLNPSEPSDDLNTSNQYGPWLLFQGSSKTPKKKHLNPQNLQDHLAQDDLCDLNQLQVLDPQMKLCLRHGYDAVETGNIPFRTIPFTNFSAFVGKKKFWRSLYYLFSRFWEHWSHISFFFPVVGLNQSGKKFKDVQLNCFIDSWRALNDFLPLKSLILIATGY